MFHFPAKHGRCGAYRAFSEMSYYPPSINEHFLNPRNAGGFMDADASAEAGSFICGAVMRLELKIDTETQTIADAKFKATGCGYLIASASVLTEIIKGLTTAEAAKASHLCRETIGEILGEIARDKQHCVRLCGDALLETITRYSQSVRDEWTGDEALICTCFGVSETRIENAIREKSLRTVKEVTRDCNAGGGCHSCHPLIEEILEDYWRAHEVAFDFKEEERS